MIQEQDEFKRHASPKGCQTKYRRYFVSALEGVGQTAQVTSLSLVAMALHALLWGSAATTRAHASPDHCLAAAHAAQVLPHLLL